MSGMATCEARATCESSRKIVAYSTRFCWKVSPKKVGHNGYLVNLILYVKFLPKLRAKKVACVSGLVDGFPFPITNSWSLCSLGQKR